MNCLTQTFLSSEMMVRFDWSVFFWMFLFNWMFIVCQVLGRSGYVVWLIAGIEDNFNYTTWKVDGAIPNVVVYHGFLLNHLLWLTPSTCTTVYHHHPDCLRLCQYSLVPAVHIWWWSMFDCIFDCICWEFFHGPQIVNTLPIRFPYHSHTSRDGYWGSLGGPGVDTPEVWLAAPEKWWLEDDPFL